MVANAAYATVIHVSTSRRAHRIAATQSTRPITTQKRMADAYCEESRPFARPTPGRLSRSPERKNGQVPRRSRRKQIQTRYTAAGTASGSTRRTRVAIAPAWWTRSQHASATTPTITVSRVRTASENTSTAANRRSRCHRSTPAPISASAKSSGVISVSVSKPTTGTSKLHQGLRPRSRSRSEAIAHAAPHERMVRATRTQPVNRA
jgi:hypothetical protein